MKPVLYLIMEIKARELEGRTLLALEAASRGFQVVIGNKEQIDKGIYSGILPQGIYYEKSLTRGKERKFEQLVNLGQIIASQDEETGLAQRDYVSFLNVRSTKKNVLNAQAVFCFGQYDYEAWIRRYPMFIEKIHLTGSPRVDFWRSDFYEYFHRKRTDLKNRFGRFVLIPGNFIGAHNSYHTIEQLIEQGKRNGSICSLEDELSRRKIFEDMEKMFDHFAFLLKTLAEKFPDINFIVRPHPSEKIHAWNNAVKDIRNVYVVFEGGISFWVRSAVAIIHNGCTTGIEACVSEVPAIAYIPFSSPVDKTIPNRLSIQCTREDEVIDVLTRIIRGEKISECRTAENERLAGNRLANIEGDTAASKIVDVLCTLNTLQLPLIKIGHLTKMRIEAKRKLFLFLKKARGIETKAMHKFPGLKLHELIQIKSNLEHVTDNYKKCMIRHLYSDVFLVEKD